MAAYGVQLNSNSKMPDYDTRNLIIKHLVGFLINDVCKNSKIKIGKYVAEMKIERGQDYIFRKQCIDFSDEIKPLVKKLKSWMDEKILFSEEVSISDSKSEYLMKQLFKAFYKHPLQLPDYMLLKYCNIKGITFSRVDISKKVMELQQDDVFVRMIADHIGGMTDQFASRTYKKLYYPDYI